jgi:hypothetical protein
MLSVFARLVGDFELITCEYSFCVAVYEMLVLRDMQ